MPSLDDLKKRSKSVKSTQKITKAMKMVAAAKLRKAQENAENGRPYSKKMQSIILNLTKSINDPENAPKLLVGTGKDETYLCVVLTADRGLCGGFNSNICKLAKANFKRIISEGKNLKIITVGSKGLDQIRRDYGKHVIKKFNFGKANLVVAIPDPWIDVQTIADLEEIAFEFRDKKKKRLRVATKYPNLTRDFLFSKGVTQFKLIDSLGATEAYPFTGSAELITDITSTGETLRANNLRILKDGEILKSQACIFTSKKNSKEKGLKNFVKLLSK